MEKEEKMKNMREVKVKTRQVLSLMNFYLIYRTCMRRAPAEPVRACTLRNWCLVSHVTFEAPLRTSHFSLQSSHSTLHTAHCTLKTPRFTLHTSHSTLYTALFALQTSHSTLHSPHFTLLTSHCFLHTPNFTLHTALFTPRESHLGASLKLRFSSNGLYDVILTPICCTYRIFTHIYHQNDPVM